MPGPVYHCKKLVLLILLGGILPPALAQDITLPAAVDFGRTHITLTNTVSIPVSNDGVGTNLSISAAFLFGGDADQFTVVDFPAVVAPGTTNSIVVEYHPDAQVNHATTLQVLSDDPDENPANVALSGEGIIEPLITLPAAVDLGEVLVSETNTMNVPVGNIGAANLAISAVTLSGANSNLFSVVSVPADVAPGMSSNIVVQYHPDAATNHSAVLDITSNDSDHSPTNVVLTGLGIEPDISLPAVFDLGQALVSETNRVILSVANVGGFELAISDAVISGADSNLFTVVSFANIVPPGASRNIVLEYHPDALTNHTATLSVTSDDPDENPAVVQLTGLGVVSRDLIAVSGTLDINSRTRVITYDSDGSSGPNPSFTYNGTLANRTATWTFGDLAIRGGTTLTFGGDDRNALRFIADGQGGAGTGNIDIRKSFNLNGENGSGNGSSGGGRRFGSGAGGNDVATAENRRGESAASDAYARPGIGGGTPNNQTTVFRGGSGGGFGGKGGNSNTGTPEGGSWYGRLDLSDLGRPGGPVAGSGGGAGNRGSAGSGGGAIQLIAVNDVFIASGRSITAEGRDGRSSAPLNPDTRRSGGGGSGGGIRLVADSDRDGSGTLTFAGATLSVVGGKADNPNILSEYAGDGGGGRIALSGAAVVAGSISVEGGDHQGGQGLPGEDGSILHDEKDATLSLSGNGPAANAYAAYTSLTVSAKSTLEVGGIDAVATVTVSNTAAVTVDGTLAMDLDGSDAGSADRLVVTNGLNISGATLDLNEITAADDAAYILAEYGSLVGTFSTVNGVPPGYILDYAYEGNQIAVLFLGEDVDLALTKTVDLLSLESGTNLTYTIVVTNLSISVFSDLVITDSLPAEATFISSEPMFTSQTNGQVVYEVSALDAGAATSFVILVSVTSAVPGMVVNTAEVASTNLESFLDNNIDMAATILPDSDMDGLANPGDPDDDNDGMSDKDEAIADTDPLDSNSVLRLTISNLAGRVVAFPTSSNRSYSLQVRTNMGFGTWMTNQAGIAGTGGVLEIPVTNHIDDTFFRILVEFP